MKKVIYYFAAILIALSFPQSVKADGEVDIILVNPSPDPDVVHRGPESAPITCQAYSDLILLFFYSSLGNVLIEVENLTTNEYNQTVVNAQAGPMIFPISGNSGLWSITFSLSTGARYYGEFNI